MKRNATAVWNGSGKEGKGTVSSQSGVLKDTQYSYKSRFEDGTGTNPEELVAAAHAGLRRLPRGPADLDAAGDGRGAAARGSRGGSAGFAVRAGRAGRSDLAASYSVQLCVARLS